MEPLNRCIAACERQGLPVFATRDWHPPDHCSFQSHGGIWPRHCVAGTPGAEFPARLSLPPNVRIISKATTAQADAYSGFQGTDLAAQLADAGCTRILIGGLATDYCVRATALDARAAGLEVVVIEDAVRAVDARPGDGQRALEDIGDSGARLISAERMLA